jgi:hypothetical protein
MTRIDPDWLEAFDEALLRFFAIDHADFVMDQILLERYEGMEAREAALAYGRTMTCAGRILFGRHLS